MYDIFKTITNSQLMLPRILVQYGDKIKKVISNAGSNIFVRVKNMMSTTLQQKMSCLT